MIVTQSPAILTPVNNYIWCGVQPDNQFTGLTNFYVQYNVKTSIQASV